MSLPERIAIGPLVYTVTDDKVTHLRKVVEDHLDTWGYIDYGRSMIVLEPDQSEAHKRMTLIHECLHGCWHVTDRKHECDEDAILALAGPLLDMLRRNPALVVYLMETDDEPVSIEGATA